MDERPHSYVEMFCDPLNPINLEIAYRYQFEMAEIEWDEELKIWRVIQNGTGMYVSIPGLSVY